MTREINTYLFNSTEIAISDITVKTSAYYFGTNRVFYYILGSKRTKINNTNCFDD